MKLDYRHITIFVLSIVLIFFIYRTKVYYEKDRVEFLLKNKEFQYSDGFQFYIDKRLIYDNKKSKNINNIYLNNLRQNSPLYESLKKKDFTHIVLAYMKLGIVNTRSFSHQQLNLSNNYFHISISYFFQKDSLKVNKIEINHI